MYAKPGAQRLPHVRWFAVEQPLRYEMDVWLEQKPSVPTRKLLETLLHAHTVIWFGIRVRSAQTANSQVVQRREGPDAVGNGARKLIQGQAPARRDVGASAVHGPQTHSLSSFVRNPMLLGIVPLR